MRIPKHAAPIILASASLARAGLLREAGVCFRAVNSGIKEQRHKKTSFASLVMENAQKKAWAVASRLERGIVIGADTIVVAGGKIWAKPQSRPHAYRMLRYLSRRSQWVYTGLAVIDTNTGKTYVDYEKTKVIMAPLSKVQIRNYFKKVNPLSKAGAFDIRGSGALFIKRIEGCYFNVVGLPLHRLCRLMVKAGVDLL